MIKTLVTLVILVTNIFYLNNKIKKSEYLDEGYCDIFRSLRVDVLFKVFLRFFNVTKDYQKENQRRSCHQQTQDFHYVTVFVIALGATTSRSNTFCEKHFILTEIRVHLCTFELIHPPLCYNSVIEM